jgi:hypothetical protein
MYVRFEKPPQENGNDKMVFSKGSGLLRARAIIGPVNPFLSDAELRNFGIWENSAGAYSLTRPVGNANFSILAPKAVLGKLTTMNDDGSEVTEQTTTPSKGGEKQLKMLDDAIMKVWMANPALRFEPGRRFELDLALPTAAADPLPMAAKTTTGPIINNGIKK